VYQARKNQKTQKKLKIVAGKLQKKFKSGQKHQKNVNFRMI